MMDVDALKAGRGSDGAEAARFAFRFGLPQVSGLRAGYGLQDTGHWPRAVERSWVSSRCPSNESFQDLLFCVFLCVWYNCYSC